MPSLSELINAELAATHDRIDAEKCPESAHAGQRELWDCVAQYVVAVCGHQSGKTYLSAYWLLREIARTAQLADEDNMKRAVYLYVCPTLTLAEAQAIPNFQRLFEDELKLGKLYKGSKTKFVFSADGAARLTGKARQIEVRFCYATDPNNLESVTAMAAVWDEAGQSDNNELSFEALLRRLTMYTKKGAGRILFTSTPYEMNWFYRRVYIRARVREAGYHLVNWPTWFNPEQSEEAALAAREEMPRWRWEMFYLGQFTKPAGAIYDCFDPEKHVVKDFKVPSHWPRYVGVDFGEVNMAAVFVAVNPETGQRFVYDSYYAGDKGEAKDRAVFRHVQRIKQVLGGHMSGCWGGARSETKFRAIYRREGLFIKLPKYAGLEEGISKVYGELVAGDLFFFRDGASKVIQDMEDYSREIDESGEPKIKIQDKHRWHRLDSLRYCVPSMPSPSYWLRLRSA